MLYCTILYYNILYYTILYHTIIYYAILYCTILYYAILYYTILYYTILYYTILYLRPAWLSDPPLSFIRSSRSMLFYFHVSSKEVISPPLPSYGRLSEARCFVRFWCPLGSTFPRAALCIWGFRPSYARLGLVSKPPEPGSFARGIYYLA